MRPRSGAAAFRSAAARRSMAIGYPSGPRPANVRRAHRTIGRADRRVLLTGPLQLHRSSLECFGHHHGVLGLQSVAVSAKAPAEVCGVNVHVLLRNAGDL